MISRRRRLHFALGFTISVIALLALLKPGDAAEQSFETPVSGLAMLRADGGQALTADGILEPNALSRLNLGFRLDPAAAESDLLAQMPGLGEKSAHRLKERGSLTKREKNALGGLLKIEENS